jgi:hypothetical protein
MLCLFYFAAGLDLVALGGVASLAGVALGGVVGFVCGDLTLALLGWLLNESLLLLGGGGGGGGSLELDDPGLEN